MRKFISSATMGFGAYWLIQSGSIVTKPSVDKVQLVFGIGAVSAGMYFIGDNHGYDRGYRKGTQQVIRHHNDIRKGRF